MGALDCCVRSHTVRNNVGEKEGEVLKGVKEYQASLRIRWVKLGNYRVKTNLKTGFQGGGTKGVQKKLHQCRRRRSE